MQIDFDDCLRLSRSGCAESRHGQGAGRRVSGLPRHVRRSRRGARRAAERALLRRARGAAAAHREHAAGDPRGQRRRLPAGARRAGSSRRSPRATASASTRRMSPPVRYPSRMPCARCGAAGGTCRRRCRSAKGRWRRSSASTRRPSARPARRRARSSARVVSPANLNAPGQVVIAGHADAVARAGELAKARGAKRVIALAVSAPFHCALMKPARGAAGAGAASAAGAAIRAIPVVANVDARAEDAMPRARSRR